MESGVAVPEKKLNIELLDESDIQVITLRRPF